MATKGKDAPAARNNKTKNKVKAKRQVFRNSSKNKPSAPNPIFSRLGPRVPQASIAGAGAAARARAIELSANQLDQIDKMKSEVVFLREQMKLQKQINILRAQVQRESTEFTPLDDASLQVDGLTEGVGAAPAFDAAAISAAEAAAAEAQAAAALAAAEEEDAALANAEAPVPVVNATGPVTVLVSNLAQSVSKADVEAVFSMSDVRALALKSVVLHPAAVAGGTQTAHVVFESGADAQLAIDTYSGRTLDGFEVKVEVVAAVPKPRREPKARQDKANATPSRPRSNSTGGNNSANKASASKPKFDGECNYCGKKGHKAADCWSNPTSSSANTKKGKSPPAAKKQVVRIVGISGKKSPRNDGLGAADRKIVIKTNVNGQSSNGSKTPKRSIKVVGGSNNSGGKRRSPGANGKGANGVGYTGQKKRVRVSVTKRR
eukprot:INCI5273.1.p1 GENE.INCI5273.1~~INCI5273.1.p1  ORF type:complete len:434 (-),score=85.40 INCI5273.1:142-1443(-)